MCDSHNVFGCLIFSKNFGSPRSDSYYQRDQPQKVGRLALNTLEGYDWDCQYNEAFKRLDHDRATGALRFDSYENWKMAKLN